eukprot:4568214-Prymnesium_polylepis.1
MCIRDRAWALHPRNGIQERSHAAHMLPTAAVRINTLDVRAIVGLQKCHQFGFHALAAVKKRRRADIKVTNLLRRDATPAQ